MVRALFALGLLFILVAPADAQSRRELAARLDAAEARIAQLEAEAGQADPVIESLLARLDGLEREQRILTGEIERLAFDNRRLRTELEQLDVNVDALLAGRPARGEAGDGPSLLEPNEIDPDDPFAEARAGDVQPLQPPVDDVAPSDLRTEGAQQGGDRAANLDPEALFAEGQRHLFQGDFFDAQEAFEAYTQYFPDGERAAEAWYRLGRTYFVTERFEDSADAYIASLRLDRRGPNAPDALVSLAAALDALGQSGRACDVLATFPQEFPNASDEARRKAQREVARIGC